MRDVLLAITVTVLCSGILAQDCVMDNFEVQRDFDVTKFLGKWYEIKWIPETYIDPEDNFKDFVWRQSLHNSSYIDIVSLGRVNAEDDRCIQGSEGLTLTEEPAKFMYNRRYNSSTRYETPFWVMLADYQFYYFAFGCRELSTEGVCIEPDAWVWSRTPQLSDEHMQLIDAKITEICLTQDQFVPTEQLKECPYRAPYVNDESTGFKPTPMNICVLVTFSAAFLHLLS